MIDNCLDCYVKYNIGKLGKEGFEAWHFNNAKILLALFFAFEVIAIALSK